MDKNPDLSGKTNPSRDAVLDAFREQLLSDGYDGLRVVDLVERSGVGRSTFYEHFSGREDVLRDSMRPVLQPLAALATAAGGDETAVIAVLEHFRQQRAVAQHILTSNAAMVRDLLAELIGGPQVRSQAIAGAQLGLLGAWVEERLTCTAAELAAALREVSAALRA